LVGPLVSIFSFICSVGNVPPAVPDISRRYYGSKVALYILSTFYVTIATAG